MGATFGGGADAPITAILILFEMTGDYRIILPLMTAVVISTLVSHVISPETIYTIKLRRRGIDILILAARRPDPRPASAGARSSLAAYQRAVPKRPPRPQDVATTGLLPVRRNPRLGPASCRRVGRESAYPRPAAGYGPQPRSQGRGVHPPPSSCRDRS